MGTLRYIPTSFDNMQKTPLFDVDTSYAEIFRRHALPLVTRQEPLGKEFERVLYDNLWDLYDRDDVDLDLDADLDADAARYTALEHPDITIRTWY